MSSSPTFEPTGTPVPRPPIDYAAIVPDLIRDLRAWTRRLGELPVDPRLRAIVELRVSQLNGCAYCADLHAREALNHGEPVQRVVGLATWHESGLFTDSEQAALGWAEALTQCGSDHVRDRAYGHLAAHFDAPAIVHLTLMIAQANAWNRIAGGLRRPPMPWGPGTFS